MHKSIRVLIFVITAWFSLSQASICRAEQPNRPNVLFVLCDDLRWNALGCMGHPHIKTPHIDSLAKQGVLLVLSL